MWGFNNNLAVTNNFAVNYFFTLLWNESIGSRLAKGEWLEQAIL